uniref:Uncharacterized protein n=1 Tax=Aplanochytrium stocchinoi TaxID=215587 RepID=A0A7S3LME4_9STRA|mmetsp:Transcript_3654/g.4317  ORF Transcript_3654/g.4317 Transcript_3654/m.4317 type:complete len:279 (+) Transcript_3654:148-984(+)|eukprot:CAMPEP_0204827670 /NCGR_PEP_ID=MMETSP1346-20131115/5110_1 /ASSEMBLY_ACC=CAM_ASM_000771 /TAXON_ID=215587 /ORGANISM="Aplanochytrium stocchinoi, Strain GSBS06" /LENGTH=278 /DNA_ID=CAMNT_0051956181 /DNA_START=71 /DNA_END=907 /DNA_ORIENTATION=-
MAGQTKSKKKQTLKREYGEVDVDDGTCKQVTVKREPEPVDEDEIMSNRCAKKVKVEADQNVEGLHACFDYEEVEKVMRKEKNYYRGINGKPSGYDLLKERAKKCKYSYKDLETFLAAIELLNRQSCALNSRRPLWADSLNKPEGWVVHDWRTLVQWEVRTVGNRHRKPCAQCGEEFVSGDYVKDVAFGEFSSPKLCIGCMGRNLKAKYGTNKKNILAELYLWRGKQGCSSYRSKEKDTFGHLTEYKLHCVKCLSYVIPKEDVDRPRAEYFQHDYDCEI